MLGSRSLCCARFPASPAVGSLQSDCSFCLRRTAGAAHRPLVLMKQVAALSWLEFCKLWKDYMTALREGLAEVNAFAAAHPGAECPAAKRLARLVYETGGTGLSCLGFHMCRPLHWYDPDCHGGVRALLGHLVGGCTFGSTCSPPQLGIQLCWLC